jgi:hypothetical protein
MPSERDVDSCARSGLVVYNGLPLDLQSGFERHTLDFCDGLFEFVLNEAARNYGDSALN